MQTTEQNLDIEKKAYEIGYLLSPLISDEKLEETINQALRAVIEKAGGILTSNQSAKMITLAYPVSKMVNNKRSLFKEAYFGALRFESQPADTLVIKAELDKLPEILRYLLLSVPNNAQPLGAQRGPLARPKISDTSDDSEAVEDAKPETVAADIDKEIEGLLTPSA